MSCLSQTCGDLRPERRGGDSRAESIQETVANARLLPAPAQISFGVAPAFVAWTLGLRTPIDTAFLTLFICAGIARLARFNATVALVPKDDTGKSKYFEGLPIPSSLFICAGMALCVREGRFEGPQGQGNGLPWGLVEPLREHLGVDVHWFAVLFAGWAAAMVSKTLRCASFLSSLGWRLSLRGVKSSTTVGRFCSQRERCRYQSRSKR